MLSNKAQHEDVIPCALVLTLLDKVWKMRWLGCDDRASSAWGSRG